MRKIEDKNIEFIEKKLFEKNVIEIFCKTSLIINYSILIFLLISFIIRATYINITFQSMAAYAFFIICTMIIITFLNVLRGKNRHRLVMQFIKENSKKSR